MKPRAQVRDADGNLRDVIDFFGDEKLSSGPYRLIRVEGVDGIWRCRHCGAYFLACVPHKPPPQCAKCHAS